MKDQNYYEASEVPQLNSPFASCCCQKAFATLEALLDHFELYHYSILRAIIQKKEDIVLMCLNNEEFMEIKEDLESLGVLYSPVQPKIEVSDPQISVHVLPLLPKIKIIKPVELKPPPIRVQPKRNQPPKNSDDDSLDDIDIKFTIPRHIKRLQKKPSTTDKTEYPCDRCDKVLIGLENFRKHEKKHIGHYSCDICGQHFVNKNKLQSHMFKHVLENAENEHLACTLCEIIFNDELQLESHLEEYHVQLREGLKCNSCSVVLMNKFQLVCHNRRYHEKRTTNCKYCWYTFKTPELLAAHIAKKHENNYVLCSHCGKSFKGKAQLLAHLEKLKPIRFHCVVCKKGFNNRRHCEVHQINVHGLGEKAFTCVTCKKGFAKLSDLKSHEISHSDATPFQCKECPMAFKRRNHLTIHVETVHMEDYTAKCLLCDKLLKNTITLRSHAKKVHKMTMSEMYRKAKVPYKGRDCVWSKFLQDRDNGTNN